MTDPNDPTAQDRLQKRLVALQHAVDLHRGSYKPGATSDRGIRGVIEDADVMYRWLNLGDPVRLVVTAGPPVDQATGEPTGTPQGGPMKDTEKILFSVGAEDAKHQPTGSPADLNWASSDENVATVQTNPDTGEAWGVAGFPGSAVITATWPDSPSGAISGTFAVDVTAGDAVSLVITAGDPVPQ